MVPQRHPLLRRRRILVRLATRGGAVEDLVDVEEPLGLAKVGTRPPARGTAARARDFRRHPPDDAQPAGSPRLVLQRVLRIKLHLPSYVIGAATVVLVPQLFVEQRLHERRIEQVHQHLVSERRHDREFTRANCGAPERRQPQARAAHES